MSKRNNKKKGKQEITQEQLRAMAKARKDEKEKGKFPDTAAEAAEYLNRGGKMGGEDVAYFMTRLAAPHLRCRCWDDYYNAAVVLLRDRYGVYAHQIGNELACEDLFRALKYKGTVGAGLYRFVLQERKEAALVAREKEHKAALRVPLWTRIKRLFDPFAE